AAATYFLANTAPVASIIGLTEGGNPFALWHKVFLWSFPNYVIGAGLTAIASAFSTLSGLATLAALMAVLFAVYQSYKMYVHRALDVIGTHSLQQQSCLGGRLLFFTVNLDFELAACGIHDGTSTFLAVITERGLLFEFLFGDAFFVDISGWPTHATLFHRCF